MYAIWHTTKRNYFDDTKYIQNDGSIVTSTAPPLPEVLEKDAEGDFRFDHHYIAMNLYRPFDYMIETKNKINPELTIAPSSILGVNVSTHESIPETYSRYTTFALEMFSQLRKEEVEGWTTLDLDIQHADDNDNENENEKEKERERKDEEENIILVVSHGDCVASIGRMCGQTIYEVEVCGFIILDIGEEEGGHKLIFKDRVYTVEDNQGESESDGSNKNNSIPVTLNLGNR